MPRLVEYPHASFKSSLEVAQAVDYLGGSCTINSCADKLSKKIGGSFRSTVNSSIKHGLIVSKKDILNTTELYRVYKLAYDEQEKIETLRKAFLFPALYTKIYERFKGKELPVSMLDKLLIREFGVEENYASRVCGYFIDGTRSLNMFDGSKLIDDSSILPKVEDQEDDNGVLIPDNVKDESSISKDVSIESISLPQISSNGSYTVMIVGPGMNTKIEINEEDDLMILDAMIKKIKKKLKEGSE